MVNTKAIPYSPSAKEAYAPQVARLNAALNTALKNAPLERQAQIIANTLVKIKTDANPNMDKADLKKVLNQAQTEARNRTGAYKSRIEIKQDEWDAIQAGAITKSKLEQILNNADLEIVKKLAMPREQPMMTSTKKARAEAMANLGYSQKEIASNLGVSLSTLTDAIAKP